MRNSCFLWLLAAGCTVESSGPASVAFVSPAPASTHVRDQLSSAGALVASIGVELDLGGDIARVTIAHGDIELGDATGGQLAAELAATGAVTLTATAYDDAGTSLATAAVDIAIADPMVADCKSWLDLYGLDYAVGPDKAGVADPITAQVPINGVSYRYSGNTDPRKTLYGDCTLMLSLAQAAPILRRHGIVELVDIGVYNYRCIGGGTPPNCANGVSQHAYAKAIDIAGFTAGDGTEYSVLTDWVIDAGGMTCTAETEGGKDTFLHDVICELKNADVWNIVLTPNYNADHRNHFHVDLTAGSDFIKRTLGEPSAAVSVLDRFE